MKNNQSNINQTIKYFSSILIAIYIVLAVISPILFSLLLLIALGGFSGGQAPPPPAWVEIISSLFDELPIPGIFWILMSLGPIYLLVNIYGIKSLLKLKRKGLYILSVLLAITIPWLLLNVMWVKVIAVIQGVILLMFILYFYKRIENP